MRTTLAPLDKQIDRVKKLRVRTLERSASQAESDDMSHDELVEMASQINEHHRQCETAARSAVEHARDAGNSLIEVKSRLGHGEWLPWLRANVECSVRMAQNYMPIADKWKRFERDPNTQCIAYLTISESLKMLASSDPKPGSLWVDQKCPSCGENMAKTSAQYVTCIECSECLLYPNPDRRDPHASRIAVPILHLRKWWKAAPEADREQFAREVKLRWKKLS